MTKGIFCLLLWSMPLFSLPQIIDFSKFPSIEASVDSTGYKNNDMDCWQYGGYAFNCAPEITPFFALLKRNYGIDTIVETGTFHGGTTILFSLLFDKVHTIEFESNNYASAKKNLEPYANVTCHFGSSEVVLQQILPTLKNQRILFYLDAHWESFWPMLDELEEISKTHQDNCVIVIDDFKVPGRPDIPYDYYYPHECSIEYVQNKLNKIFSSYTTHYLIPKSKNCRAKFIAIPTTFTKN